MSSFPAPRSERLPSFLERARFQWQQRYTPTGRVVLAAVVILGITAAFLGIEFPLFLLAAPLLGLLLMAHLAAVLALPRASLERRLPERCALGATVPIACRVTHQGGWSGLDLAVVEYPTPAAKSDGAAQRYHRRLEPGKTVTLGYDFTPARRGAHRFSGPWLISSFPFGLFHAARPRANPARVLVYPRYTPLAQLDLPAQARYQSGGALVVSHVGEAEEFIGNRDYRAGDRLRDLDHRAWARVGAPIVREYQQEYLTRVALIVDTHLGPRPRAWTTRRRHRADAARVAALEAALSLAAAVADKLSGQDYVVDLFAAGATVHHFQAGRHLAYLDHILDVLACLEGSEEDPVPSLEPALRDELEGIATAVAIFLDWDQRRADLLRMIESHGVATKALVVRAGPCTQDPGPRARIIEPSQVLNAGLAL